jgi:hypothetical protein
MAVNLSPVFGVAGQLFDNNGNPLAGGKIFTYLAGSTTPATTYTSSLGNIAHSNPIVLDGAGRVPSGEIWLTDGITYKFVVQDSANNLIGTYDNLTGINSNFVAYTNSQEIQTATAGQTVFNLTTMQYQPGTNSLTVFVDGVNQYGPGAQYAYVETDSDTVTFVSGLHVGASVKFTTSQLNSSGAADASQVSYSPAGTGAVATNVQVKLREYVTFQDFGAAGDGITDDTAAVQAAITYASSERLTIFAYGGFLITSTINFPTGTNGCTIQGQSKQTYFKFAGTGAMFASVSTNSIVMRNLTLVGPGSNIGATGLSLQTNDTSVGVYYCVFEDLTIEAFRFGMSIAGLCEPVFRKINIGLNKSGIFTGTPQEGTPLIGISIGSTVLAAQFEGLTIFASQRCVSQTTEQQLAEGHYWFGCTFDLSFNNGASSDQACVFYESGQDMVFTSCWFTNSQKYGSTSSPYTDNLVRIAYDPGSINAPLVAFKFVSCSFVGNGMSLQFGAANPNRARREFAFTGCVFRLWANLGKIVMGGSLSGAAITGNTFQLYGDDAGGGTAYNLPQTILEIADLSEYTITGNAFGGILPITNAVTYITLGDTSAGIVADNAFPVQTSLSSGNDVTIQGTSANVIVDGWQQTSRKFLTQGITAGTYNTGSPVVASINTGLTKPCNAIIQVYIDNATITNPGGATMLFELEGLSDPGTTKRQVNSTGAQSIDYTFTGLVSGTVNFKVNASLQMVVGSGTTAKFMTITFI